tara:strand:- start:170 stop:676 length:507 start_codon:yes stop_codon:yes gene_type:complete
MWEPFAEWMMNQKVSFFVGGLIGLTLLGAGQASQVVLTNRSDRTKPQREDCVHCGVYEVAPETNLVSQDVTDLLRLSRSPEISDLVQVPQTPVSGPVNWQPGQPLPGPRPVLLDPQEIALRGYSTYDPRFRVTQEQLDQMPIFQEVFSQYLRTPNLSQSMQIGLTKTM